MDSLGIEDRSFQAIAPAMSEPRAPTRDWQKHERWLLLAAGGPLALFPLLHQLAQSQT